jgi:O-antigen/teichoic acid export membrane protein
MEHENRDNAFKHILKYTGLFGGVQGLSILVALVRNKIVALLLGPMGMGLMSLFNSTVNFVSSATNLGLGTSAVKDISEAYAIEDARALRRSVQVIRAWSFVTALLGLLVCAVFSPLLSRYTFGWGKHTIHFLLLSPVVAMTAITGGELAILKGTRHLKGLASISIINVVLALVLSVPLFIVWRVKAIVPSMIIVALSQMIVTIAYSYHYCPLHWAFNRPILMRGWGMIKLGVAFLLAGMFGSGADFLIRSFVNNTGSPDMLGLYNAGYMITVTYGGMVFSAMETDYYPRLSSIVNTGFQLNETVNKQIEVSLLIISPMLVALIIGLPLIIPLLYSGAFAPVVAMAQLSALALYLRAAKLPIAYLPLARSDSRAYLLMEGIYAIVYILLSFVCFRAIGLLGLGLALVLVAVFDFVMLNIFMHYRYGYRFSKTCWNLLLQQLPIGILAYALTWMEHNWAYWVVGVLLTLLSLAMSLKKLRSGTR